MGTASDLPGDLPNLLGVQEDSPFSRSLAEILGELASMSMFRWVIAVLVACLQPWHSIGREDLLKKPFKYGKFADSLD